MLLVSIFFTTTLIISPVLKSLLANEARVYKSRARELHIKWAQHCYPELKNLSWKEIEQNYSIEDLFNSIR